MLNEGACQITKMFKCSIINSSTYKSARQNDLIANLKRYLPIQIFRYIYVCQWLWLGSQQPSAEFNCSLPPGPVSPVSTAQILCQQSLFVECGLGIRRYVAAGAPPNITTLGFTPSNSNMTNGVRPPCAMCDRSQVALFISEVQFSSWPQNFRVAHQPVLFDAHSTTARRH